MTHDTHQLEHLASGQGAIDVLSELAHAVEMGAIDPLAAFITLTKVERIAKELKDQFKDGAIRDAERWGQKTFTYFGATIERKAAAGRWDFKGIPAWSEAKAALSAIEERAKHSYQAAQKYGMQTATEDGEEIELPIYTAGGETLAVKI
jgi:hypothetical protein